jgi:GNAT superfamily N-acetyltransferase
MTLNMRKYQNEDDYWRLRDFLRRVCLDNDLREYAWQVARLDYWRWHVIPCCTSLDGVEEVIFLWEDEAGQIQAAVNPTDLGELSLQVHPAYRSIEMEAELLAVAEEKLAPPPSDQSRRLRVWARVGDTLREELLQHNGYQPGSWSATDFYQSLKGEIPDPVVPSGYQVRSLGGEDELPSRSYASWRAFHPDDPEDKYQGWEWYHRIQRMPLYRRDLDLVAEAPDGEVAAFTTLWYDDVTRSGYFEPVGTVPEHQRRGLARALLQEGMRRIRRLGAVQVTVGGVSEAAKKLYASVMPDMAERYLPWVKEL